MKFFSKKPKKTRFNSAIVSHIERLTPNAVAIDLRLPKNIKKDFTFIPGQYITLEIDIDGAPIRRAYSICSTTNEETLRIGIKRLKNGLFSEYANNNLKVGDQIQIAPPEGRFVLDNTSKEIVSFVSGSGITPVFSIIKTGLQEDKKKKFVLVYGNKTPEETMFYKELISLESMFSDRFKIYWVFSNFSEKKALYGRIDEEKINFVLNGISIDKFLICGPQKMIEETMDVLIKKDFSKKAILYELFTSKNNIQKESVSSKNNDLSDITIILEGEAYTFKISKKTSILEGALKNNIDVPYSCQGGVCASCSARILSGEVDIAMNHVLTDSDLEDKMTITCQSYPKTAEVKVSYDDL